MASLRKFPNSKFWYACFTMPDGRRAQRSTKETKRKDAQVKADQWETLSRERVKARQANRVIADIYRAAHNETLPNATPRTYIEGWLKRRKGEVAPASYTSYSNRASHFIEWLGSRADDPIGELDTRDFVSYRNALAERVSPSTSNHGIKILRSIFEDARRERFVAENPAKDCGLLKRDTQSTRRPFTLDELKSVIAVAGEEWRSMIFFGLYTGQRLTDIANLSWSNIDLEADEIHLTTAKTHRMVRIPICKPLRTHIDSLSVSDIPAQPIHPTAAALARTNGSTLSRQFGELVGLAGLLPKQGHDVADDDRKGRNARRRSSELYYHSLRHTATSIMKNAGISPAVVQDIIGHESAEISAHYTHIEHRAKKEALNALPDLR